MMTGTWERSGPRFLALGVVWVLVLGRAGAAEPVFQKKTYT
jgi:hypothetical protein